MNQAGIANTSDKGSKKWISGTEGHRQVGKSQEEPPQGVSLENTEGVDLQAHLVESLRGVGIRQIAAENEKSELEHLPAQLELGGFEG